jgi:hypothetical protein
VTLRRRVATAAALVIGALLWFLFVVPLAGSHP